MKLSPEDIQLITRLISEKLGAGAAAEDVKSLAREIVNRLLVLEIDDAGNVSDIDADAANLPAPASARRRLIVNAFGPDRDGLLENLKRCLENLGLPLLETSCHKIDAFRSIIAVIDYSESADQIGRIKFELDKICSEFEFRAIIQDSAYYGL
jgi:predicted amino acid-binding ACT domain protein